MLHHTTRLYRDVAITKSETSVRSPTFCSQSSDCICRKIIAEKGERPRRSAAERSRGSVLVVGVGTREGLGATIARRFAERGYPVVVAGRNTAKLSDTLNALGSDIHSVVGDAADPADVARFLAAANKRAPLSVVVHNAGSNQPAPFLNVSAKTFEQHWSERALGGFRVAKTALPFLLKSGRGLLFFTGTSDNLRGRVEEKSASLAPVKATLCILAQRVAHAFRHRNIHIGHIAIDGSVEAEHLLSRAPACARTEGGGVFSHINAVAEAYWVQDRLHRNAWTLELDLRP